MRLIHRTASPRLRRAGAFSAVTAALVAAWGCSASATDDAVASGGPAATETGTAAAMMSRIAPDTAPPLPAGCATPQPIVDPGYPVFRAYADANADGTEDYCRFIGDPPNEFLSCLLGCPAGNYGDPVGFNSITGIDQGWAGTQAMRDVNGDGRADFCRTVGNPGGEFVSCDLSTPTGFDPNPSTLNLAPAAGCNNPQPIGDLGYPGFRVQADANGDSLEDYCRFIGDPPNEFLSCLLACPGGNYGDPTGFNTNPGIDQGYAGTQTMRDVNGDGRSDFCRLVGNPGGEFISCDLATANGFDPNPSTLNLPANTPLFTVAVQELTPAPVTGAPITLGVTITNNLPFAQAGSALATLTPSGGGTAINASSPGAFIIPPDSSVTRTMNVFVAPAGTYSVVGMLQQNDGHVVTTTGQSSAQNVTVGAGACPNDVEIDSLTSTPLRISNEVNYQVYGDPFQLEGTVRASRGGTTSFALPMRLDGVSQPTTTFLPSSALNTVELLGPMVTASTATTHTLAIDDGCGFTTSRQVTITKINPTAPVPTITPGATYVNAGAAVTLTGTYAKTFSTCLNGTLRLVGKQLTDNKVVLDETYGTNTLIKTETVHPQYTTQYTVTATCSAYPSIQHSGSTTVSVYNAPPTCPGGGYPGQFTFCRSCPSGIGGDSYDATLIETACTESLAEQMAQATGTNCEVSSGACD